MTNFTSHQIDSAIVELAGLGSVLDIDTVNEERYRYEVILEDGSRLTFTKNAVHTQIETETGKKEKFLVVDVVRGRGRARVRLQNKVTGKIHIIQEMQTLILNSLVGRDVYLTQYGLLPC